MPQLHFSVSDQLADRIRQNAESAGLSTSQYLAQLIENSLRREGRPVSLRTLSAAGRVSRWNGVSKEILKGATLSCLKETS
jgi:hypothetical protein